MTQNPQNGPEPSNASTASGRSRGTYTRKRSSQINTFLKVFKAVDKIGEYGKHFSTTECAKAAGVSTSQAYTWLQALRAHGLVSAKLVASRRPSGDWRWRRKVRIVKVRSK